MNQEDHSNDEECLLPERVMAFLDDELEQDEAAAVESHLKACARCRQMAEGLATMSKAVAVRLTCLDDESMAAYVDHRAGRTRGAVSDTQLQRIRAHLDRCGQCREEVEILAQACQTRVRILGRLASLLVARTAVGRPATRSALRWTAAAAAFIAIGALAYLALLGRGPVPAPPGERKVVKAPVASTPESGPRTGEQPPSKVQSPEVEPGVEAPAPTQERPRPRPQLSTEMALISGLEVSQEQAADALAALSRAREARDAPAQARAARELASIYHTNRAYQSAARYYREAADAAEKAGKAELQVDSRLLLGACLAEAGKTGEAREQFGLALDLARRVGYEAGEANALVQLRVLDGSSGEGER